MVSKKLNRKAVISFIIFCIILLKDVLVSDFKLIPIRSPANRAISWFIILPLTIIGVFLSFQILKKKSVLMYKEREFFIDANILISIPILLYVLYVLFIG
jgi:hypothetical protein